LRREPFRTCLDRPYVQKEIRWARQAGKNIIIVFEEDRRKQAFFDYGLATEKYGSTEWSFLLGIDAITYRRNKEEAQAMLNRILEKVKQPAIAGATEADAEPINAPGRWDVFLSHGQAAAGDQVKALSLLLGQRTKPDGSTYTVWYDNAMSDCSETAMQEGAEKSDNFLLFLSGDPELSN
jgi:hypothetical protein